MRQTLGLVLLVVILGVSIAYGQGECSGNSCTGGLCCSQYGYCGSTADYCGTGCQGGPCTGGSATVATTAATTAAASSSSTSSSSSSSTTGSTGSSGLAHPGILVGAAQLAYIKTSVQNQVQPMYTAYTKAVNSALGSKTYQAKGPNYANIACGSYSDPDDGCSDDDNDATAAYLQALLWYISGDSTYAQNAIKLMNSYASKVTQFTLANAPLQAGWSASKWPRAAEIIRHTSTLWADSDFTKFVNWLNNVHLPLIKGGSSASNGNWELAMIEGTMNIAILSDNSALFNQAVTMWKQRVPAYFYTTSDGSSPVPAPRGTSDWHGQNVWNSNVNGICQETCRDMGHTQFGLESTLNAAATAATQGVDLFGLQQTRLIAAMEFNAQWVNGVTPPSYVCNGAGVDASTKYPGWELGYNHYHNKEGVSMPNTLKFITNYVRAQSIETDYHICVWETLTNSGFPSS